MSEIISQADEIRGHVHAALEKRRLGVDYGYDVALAAMAVQTPAGPRVVPVYIVLITRPSPLIGGAPLSHIAQVQHARPSFELIDEQVAEGLRLLAELHAELKKPPPAPPAGPVRALANGRRL